MIFKKYDFTRILKTVLGAAEYEGSENYPAMPAVNEVVYDTVLGALVSWDGAQWRRLPTRMGHSG